jgi:hypothetical protein
MAMWPFSRSKQREIEGRLDRLAVANTMFCYVTAMCCAQSTTISAAK